MMKSSLAEKTVSQKKKDDNICNFFQSSMNKLAKHSSDSGVHLVGPMFEMTAWMDSKIANYEFELEYPASSVSYGPTICSFGLEYNDHNYALPTGLTPPSMAPHLVDLDIPFKAKRTATINPELMPSDVNDVQIIDSPKKPMTETPTNPSSETPPHSGENPALKSPHKNPVVVISKKKITIVDTNDKSEKNPGNVTQFNEGMSESKKKLFSAWHAKAAESGHLVVTQNWPYNAEFLGLKGKYKAKAENAYEIKHGHEPKLLQIPDYLAVSPSALSDTDEEMDVKAAEPFGASGIVNGTDLAPSDFPTWFLLRCACGIRNTRQRLVQCTRCNYWQHLDCMMAMYSEIEERNSAKMASLTANTGSSRRHNSRLVPEVSKCSGKGALEFVANAAKESQDKSSKTETEVEDSKRVLVTISPNNYICELCGERPVNIEIAEKIQNIHAETEEIQLKTLNAIKDVNNKFMAGLSASCLNLDKGKESSDPDQINPKDNDDKKSVASDENVDTGQILDRALKLGLIDEASADTKNPKNKGMLLDDINNLINQAATEAAASSADKAIANHRAKMALEALNASKEKAINEALDAGKKKLATTNINQRVPSPPRASKRKQDLSNKPNPEKLRKEAAAKENTAQPESTGPQKCQMPFAPASLAIGADPNAPITPFPLKRTLFQDQLYNNNSTGRVRGGYNTILKRYACAAAMLAESTAAMYNPLGNAWTKNYREADHNIYSKALMAHITSKLELKIDINFGIPPHSLTRNPLCRVVMFDHNDKGLEASISLSCNEVVIEARGRLMLMEEYEHYRDPYSDYNRYGFIYKKFSDRAIVIDASSFGNDARFIRRSCIPNCNLDHVIIRGKLHLVVRTLMDVTPGNELTLPFDIDYRALHYPIDCACGRSRCPVQKWSRKLLRNKVVPSMDYSKYIESQLKVLSTPLNPDVPNSNSMYSQSTGLTTSTSSNPYENSIIGSPLDAYRSSPWSTPGNTPIKNAYPKSPGSLPTTPNKGVMASPGGGSVTVKRKLASGCSIIKEVPVSPDGEIRLGETMNFEMKKATPASANKPNATSQNGPMDTPKENKPQVIDNHDADLDSSLIIISDESGERTPKRPRRTLGTKSPTEKQAKMQDSASKRARKKKQILDI